MKLAAGWGLVGVLLVLRVQGDVPADKLTETQNKTIRLVMEKFHQRDLQNGYRMTSIVKAEEELYVAGIFVNVEFLVKQTSCLKNDWSKPDCKAEKHAKTYNCFGCYKFDHESASVMSQVEECILPRHLNAGRRDRRRGSCMEVEKKENGKKNLGRFSFVKGGPV